MSALHSDYKIVEPLLGTYDYDGIAFDCYGTIHAEGPELIQIALQGSPIDQWFLLDRSVLDSVHVTIERAWLNAKVHAAPANTPFSFALQAH